MQSTRPDHPAGPRVLWGRELRHYRQAAALTQEQLAKLVTFSESLISSVENGTRKPQEDFARRCDDALGTGGALFRLLEMFKNDAIPASMRPIVTQEKRAAAIHNFAPLAVPGMLQTDDYARAQLTAGMPGHPPEHVDELVAARLQRKEILDRDTGPMLYAVLDETVIRRPVGGAAVLRAQLDRLVEWADHPRVTIQIIPFATGAYAGLTSPLVLLRLPDRGDIAYIEDPVGGRLIEDATDVHKCVCTYEALRAEALAASASLEVIKKATVDPWI